MPKVTVTIPDDAYAVLDLIKQANALNPEKPAPDLLDDWIVFQSLIALDPIIQKFSRNQTSASVVDRIEKLDAAQLKEVDAFISETFPAAVAAEVPQTVQDAK